MISLPGFIRNISKRRAVSGALILAWISIFFAGSLPAVKKTLKNRDSIRSASDRIESMTSMSAAGGWFAAAVSQAEPGLLNNYGRLFPADKQRDDLFLGLAGLARKSGIAQFSLKEIPIIDDYDGSEGFDDDPAMDDDGSLDMLVQQYATDTSTLPETRLDQFRVAAGFETDYSSLTRFLEGLETIPRALSIHSLDLEQGRNGVLVTMELDYYARTKD